MSQGARIIFAKNIRIARKAKGLSQEDLAEEADLHRNYLGGVERGERNVSIDNMDRIAKALGLSLPSLLQPTLFMQKSGKASPRGPQG